MTNMVFISMWNGNPRFDTDILACSRQSICPLVEQAGRSVRWCLLHIICFSALRISYSTCCKGCWRPSQGIPLDLRARDALMVPWSQSEISTTDKGEPSRPDPVSCSANHSSDLAGTGLPCCLVFNLRPVYLSRFWRICNIFIRYMNMR